MSSEHGWREWKEATFGTEYMIWHDGLPVEAVTGLQGEAREQALEMLRQGVSEGDSHAAEALAAMGDTATIGEMRKQLKTAGPADLVRLALAIHAVEPDPDLAEELLVVLFRSGAWAFRMEAAIGLRHFSGPRVTEALLTSVARDPDYLVRYHAANSFLGIHGLQPATISDHATIFPLICGPEEGAPAPEDHERYGRARQMLEELRDNAGRASGI